MCVGERGVCIYIINVKCFAQTVQPRFLVHGNIQFITLEFKQLFTSMLCDLNQYAAKKAFLNVLTFGPILLHTTGIVWKYEGNYMCVCTHLCMCLCVYVSICAQVCTCICVFIICLAKSELRKGTAIWSVDVICWIFEMTKIVMTSEIMKKFCITKFSYEKQLIYFQYWYSIRGECDFVQTDAFGYLIAVKSLNNKNLKNF